MANLKSTLTVSLTDDVSGPANRAAGALHKLGASGNDLKRLQNATTGKLAADLERLNKAAGQVKGLRDATKALGQSGTEFRAARQNVTQLTTALAKAEERLGALKGQRGAEDQRLAAQREVQGIKRDLRAATAVMQETKGAYLEQGRAVRSLQGELKGAGVSLRNLHRQESQLAQATARTNAALSMREAMLGPRGRLTGALRAGATDALAARMGEGDNRRQLNERYGARMLEGMGAPSRSAAARSEAAAQAAEARAARRAEARAGRREAAGTVGAAAGVAAGHFIEHGAHASLETYREFDKERRFGKAVMGISDEEQEPLIHQAIHMGASTRYNDVSVMESQRELAARGLKRDQVMGLMEPAANLGQSLDLKLPDAVKQMEGAIFGFKKDISTLQAAQKSASQTADIQVKAAKISGMTPEDITQTYKYGATPARMAGMSEASLLAFAGISKKANMGGDEAGVAFRALVANAMSPTRGAKEAMLANGMDYKNYQRMPDRIDTDAFTRTVSAQYGVQLDKSTKGKLDKIFTNKDLIADPSKFTPAVMNLLSDSLDGDDAKSKKSIAGLANRFRDKSMKGVDTDRLVEDLMTAIPKNPALANAIFGSKQGARIANALGDPDTFKHMLEELIKHSQGYAEKIAKERQAGFDGAMDRLKGATMNLETAVGRAWDNNGKGGLLTKGTDMAGKAVQGLAELDAKSLLASTAMLGLAGSIGSVAGALRLAGTFMGLPALTALGGMTAAIGAATLAATGFAAALYVLSDEKKGIVHGGKPDGQLNPQDELPGLGSDPDLTQAPPGLPKPPRMSLADGVPSLLSEKHEALYQGLAEANEQAAKLRKELADAKAEADGMAGISVPGIADAAKAKVVELEKQKRDVDDRIRSMRQEMEGSKPSLPPGGAQPASRAAEGVPSLIDAASGRNAGAMAKAREDLAAYERELSAVNERLAKQASTGLSGFGGGLEGRKAELEGMIEAMRDKIQAIGRETIAPKADASGLDPLKQGLGEVKDKAAEVNALTIRPQADGGNLGSIITQLNTIKNLVGEVNAGIAGMRSPGGGGNTGAVRRAAGNNH